MNLAISGKIASGKDSLADYIVDNYPGKFVKVAFANELKELARARFLSEDDKASYMTNFSKRVVEMYGNTVGASRIWEEFESVVGAYPEEFHAEKPRRVLQDLGNRFRDVVKKDIWVQLLLAQVRKINDVGVNAIVTDMRYQNELDILASKGFYLLRIEIDKGEQMKRYGELYGNADASKLTHISETDLDQRLYDFTDIWGTDMQSIKSRWGERIKSLVELLTKQ